MKNKISKLAALLLAASMCASFAGCGESKTEEKTEQEQVNEAVNELDEKEKEELNELKEEVEAEMGDISESAEASSEAEAPAEDLGLKDPKYYTYYEDLAKSYAEADLTSSGGSYFYMTGVSTPLYLNGKVYLSFKGSDNSAFIYSYDIAGSSLDKVFEFTEKKAEGKYKYDCWYVKGDDLYLMYDSTVEGLSHIEKIGKDGKVEDYDISDGFMVNQIAYVFDNGKILITANGDSNFELYDPAEKKLTQLEVIPVPSDHAGITQDLESPMFMYAKGNSFYFGDKMSLMSGGPLVRDGIVYEYDTDKDEASVFLNDELLNKEDPNITIFGDYLMLVYKSGLERMFSVIKLSDGTKIIDDERNFSPYLGGDGSYYRDLKNKKWYKLKYPDSTYEGQFEKAETLMEVGEELSDETAGSETIVQLDDKYYVCFDDAGYFLRTYEKGEADEQLIITQKQIEEDQNY